jgi:hypothetical protein
MSGKNKLQDESSDSNKRDSSTFIVFEMFETANPIHKTNGISENTITTAPTPTSTPPPPVPSPSPIQTLSFSANSDFSAEYQKLLKEKSKGNIFRGTQSAETHTNSFNSGIVYFHPSSPKQKISQGGKKQPSLLTAEINADNQLKMLTKY